MAFDILAALSFMHEMNVLHRDIKPSSIMLTEVDGRMIFKLIDLGICCRGGGAGRCLEHTRHRQHRTQGTGWNAALHVS